MENNKLHTIRQNKVKQRGDTTLNRETATALLQMVFNGQSIFSKQAEKERYITLPDGSKIPYRTVNSWIQRRNVVPETGERLKDILKRAKEEYRRRAREQREEEILDQIEEKFSEILSINPYYPVKDKDGNIVYDKSGDIVYDMDANLLRTQLNAAKFIWDRIGPEKYN
jgi:PAS domain-containing protein